MTSTREKADAELREAIHLIIRQNIEIGYSIGGAAWDISGYVVQLIAAREASLRADYEAVLADKRRLVRELDVALHGEAGAAKQASLCDLIEPAKALRAERDQAVRALGGSGWTLTPGAAEWRPPLGKRPDFEQIDELRATLAATRAELAEARAALEPFAAVAEHDLGQDEADDDLYQVYWYNRAPHITVGHLRRARAALEAKQ